MILSLPTLASTFSAIRLENGEDVSDGAKRETTNEKTKVARRWLSLAELIRVEQNGSIQQVFSLALLSVDIPGVSRLKSSPMLVS